MESHIYLYNHGNLKRKEVVTQIIVLVKIVIPVIIIINPKAQQRRSRNIP